MGLGLPDGGHLTHGYYVNLFLCLESYVRSFHVDSQKEDDGVVDLFPIIPIWARPYHAAC
jgi:glycine/serine hydroxymethyltransferase